jgi:hypothetical protein
MLPGIWGKPPELADMHATGYYLHLMIAKRVIGDLIPYQNEGKC